MSQRDEPLFPEDPRPLPPREPAPEECCGGGCDPCVYDRYYLALDRYEESLKSWLLRHPEAAPGPPPGSAPID